MTSAPSGYIHGYSEREIQRLVEQAAILEDILHSGTRFSPGELILEAGCGVGAQTAILRHRHPGARIVSMDFSAGSVAAAVQHADGGDFLVADVTSPPFKNESFDHIFICFVLEHIADPVEALKGLYPLLKPGGTVTLIEGDHEACVWFPWSEASATVWRAMIRVQQDLGHDPLIGRRLHSLLSGAGFDVESCEPRIVYGDAGAQKLLEGMVNQIIVPMTITARESALSAGYVEREEWNEGIADLERSGRLPQGSFFYSFFKAVGRRP
ncbi:MAG: methyltransferase domain-containing protein [Nitrospinota bacterium]|nr:methyltransferase domain-containing protein [Nitrospinota bacterium]MDH5757189.1 methyltransferase domain-containing protein [Nitrospinota bacterium]